jgi:hypothetical protein
MTIEAHDKHDTDPAPPIFDPLTLTSEFGMLDLDFFGRTHPVPLEPGNRHYLDAEPREEPQRLTLTAQTIRDADRCVFHLEKRNGANWIIRLVGIDKDGGDVFVLLGPKHPTGWAEVKREPFSLAGYGGGASALDAKGYQFGEPVREPVPA